MKLTKMSGRLGQTTLRWVISEDGRIVGTVGKAKDALAADFIRLAEALPIVTWRDKNEWVAIRVDSELVRGHSSRIEAVAALFRKGEQG